MLHLSLSKISSIIWCSQLFCLYLQTNIDLQIVMKRIALFLIAALALLPTVNGKNGVNANAEQVQDTTVLGKLYFVNLKEGEKPVMTALSLTGNRCGSEVFNSKPFAAEGIRSVFELDEWIEFHPKASVGGGIKVMFFKHQADQSFYLTKPLNDKTPGYIQEHELNKDPEAEENNHWGSFYLHPEEVAPGYYDFVFLYKGKVFAIMPTHFYKPDEIYGKSDSELEQLMKQPVK